MNKFASFAALALLAATSISAEARDRWRYRDVAPWHNDGMIYLDDEDDASETAYYDDEADEIIVLPKRKQRVVADDNDEQELWWLDDGAQRKLEQRAKSRNIPVKKPVVKKAAAKPAPVVAAKPKPVAAAAVAPKPVIKPANPAPAPAVVAVTKPADPVQTASIAKAEAAVPVEKPKAKSVIAKAAPAKLPAKTIGCTAGAAVIVGYGFAEVKPKTCTGEAYTYTATRAEKNYEIKLTAKSGEITDVKKVN